MRPGMMPSFTSGWPTCAPGRDHAIVAGHRGLQAAAECLAVDRHHHRLRALLDRRRNGSSVRPRLLPAHNLAELPYVGAGDEGPARAHHHDGLHVRIGRRAFDGGLNRFGNSRAQRVHRRIIDRDDGNLFLAGKSNGLAHVAHSLNRGHRRS